MRMIHGLKPTFWRAFKVSNEICQWFHPTYSFPKTAGKLLEPSNNKKHLQTQLGASQNFQQCRSFDWWSRVTPTVLQMEIPLGEHTKDVEKPWETLGKPQGLHDPKMLGLPDRTVSLQEVLVGFFMFSEWYRPSIQWWVYILLICVFFVEQF